MNNLKFRAWDTMRKEISSVRGVRWGRGRIVVDCANGHRIRTVPLKEVKIMQYTGLKDKNGKEIFEGDIVEFTDKIVGSPIICNGYVTKNIEGKFIIEPIEDYNDIGYWTLFWTIMNDSSLKITGNIYEDPELLKEVEE